MLNVKETKCLVLIHLKKFLVFSVEILVDFIRTSKDINWWSFLIPGFEQKISIVLDFRQDGHMFMISLWI